MLRYPIRLLYGIHPHLPEKSSKCRYKIYHTWIDNMGMFQVVSSQSAFQVHGNPFGLDVLLHLLCVVRACLGFPVSCLGTVREGPWWEIQLKIIERPREEQQTSKLWGTLQKNNGKHKVTKIYYQIGIKFIQISHPRHFAHQQKNGMFVTIGVSIFRLLRVVKLPKHLRISPSLSAGISANRQHNMPQASVVQLSWWILHHVSVERMMQQPKNQQKSHGKAILGKTHWTGLFGENLFHLKNISPQLQLTTNTWNPNPLIRTCIKEMCWPEPSSKVMGSMKIKADFFKNNRQYSLSKKLQIWQIWPPGTCISPINDRRSRITSPPSHWLKTHLVSPRL